MLHERVATGTTEKGNALQVTLHIWVIIYLIELNQII